jgi:hypothetical protein
MTIVRKACSGTCDRTGDSGGILKRPSLALRTKQEGGRETKSSCLAIHRLGTAVSAKVSRLSQIVVNRPFV